ncbi:MAG: flippase-like domain-containing protein [Candidatus Latescibacteria bacterium]|nr:flippase-like domain-containing protein [Candidatus Latescibacterota bacterium]NIM20920.1 flippase-like domain-containing protein [Candidatus Latescibacterota bacterium]NIM65055.1 flippase-like domain-containing protein [Candidatus Latescibacterota bacterium]NIO01570.1 flippase-like domain-containing protein [Candidatus Latescibacterota bacterium]NIO28087.1 flippase-like domain-containing protein [Candidatus Latescibacterota bacterium]
MLIRFDKSSILKGLRISLGLSILSVALIFVFTKPGETLTALKQIRPLYLLVALGVACVDWLGGGLRLYVLTQRITKEISYGSCLRASLANAFMGAVTPSQTGGGPAQIYVLYKEGLPIVASMSLSFITFLGTVIFLVISMGTITLFGLNSSITSDTIRVLFRYGVSAFLGIGVLVIFFVSKPDLLSKSLKHVFNFMSLFRKKHFLRPEGKAHDIIEKVDSAHRIFIYYLRYRWSAIIAVVLVTGLVFAAKFFVAYLIVRGLGVSAGIWEVFSIQILIILAVYFCPTPGSSGAAELGSAILMSSIVPVELLTVYVVLWRVIVTYIAVLLGSYVVLRYMGKETVTLESEIKPLEKKIAV